MSNENKAGSAAQAVAYARYRSTFGNGATLHWCDRKDEGAFPLFAAPPVADAEGVKELIDATNELMRWCVGKVDIWNFPQYDRAHKAVAALSRLNGEKK